MSRNDDEEGGASPLFNAPFRGLAKLVGPLPSAARHVARKPRPAAKPAPPVPPPSPDDDLHLFEAAVR
ncbi:MAG TPA: hypothetical protein VLF14_03965, partial [Candidatus Binatia bacterium]|nr:hypothetical protein [Candidatus Binatia bacterium]